MTPFIALQPTEFGDALALLAKHAGQTKLMAGGQSLLLALKERTLRPSYVLSLAGMPELSGIATNEQGELEVGAATTYATLAKARLSGWHAEIARVARNLADRSVRSMGTIGGAACQADPRYDVPTLLVATDATMMVVSSAGTRLIPAADFFNPLGGTHLAADEILVRIVFPPENRFSFVGFDKFRFRVFDAATLTMACALATTSDGTVTTATIAVGGVKPAPSLPTKALRHLVGKTPGSWVAQDVATAVSEEVLPDGSATTRHLQFQAELMKSLTLALLQRASSPSQEA